MQITDVELIIRNALGLKESDSLKVVNAKFHRSAEATAEQEPADWSRYVAVARHLSLGIMAICALIVLRIFSRARGKTMASVQGQATPEAGSSGPMPPGELIAEPAMVRQQIAHALRQNPEQVRQMFLTWIQEKQ
jgi:flagellar biosynthesis/type III secretory pathway M-ring protein FliF/YscJ